MLLLRKNSKKVEEIRTLELGIYVGLTETADFKGFVSSKTLSIRKGDIVMLYTDGVTEAENSKKEQYGTKKLMDAFLKYRDKSSKDIVENIYKDIYSFIENSEVYDDITMVLMRRK